MNATELASLMFPFDPETDTVLFYGATMAYCATGFYNILLITSRILKRCIPKRESKEVPFAKLTNVIVEPPKGHEITPE